MTLDLVTMKWLIKPKKKLKIIYTSKNDIKTDFQTVKRLIFILLFWMVNLNI